MTTRQIDALVTAFAAWLATTIVFALHLDDAWWAAITVWMVMNVPERHAILVKGILRVVGTIFGAVIGYLVAVWAEGQTVLQMVVIAGAVAIGCYQRHRAEYAYAWFMSFLVIAMLVAKSLDDPAGIIEFAWFRVYEIVVGVSIVAALTLCLKPLHQEAGTTAAPAAPVDEKKLFFACLFVALMAILVITFWQVYNIPSVFQVLVTITAVQFPDLADTRKMALNRLAGCIMGGTAGLLLVGLANQSFALWSLTFMMGLYLFSFIHHGGSRTIHPYIGTQAGLAFIIATVTGSGPSATILPVVERIAGIFVAFVIIGVSAYAAEPWVRHWTQKRVPAA